MREPDTCSIQPKDGSLIITTDMKTELIVVIGYASYLLLYLGNPFLSLVLWN